MIRKRAAVVLFFAVAVSMSNAGGHGVKGGYRGSDGHGGAGQGWSGGGQQGSGYNSGGGQQGSGYSSGYNKGGGQQGFGYNSGSGQQGSGYNSGGGQQGSGYNSGGGQQGSGYNKGSGQQGSGYNPGSGQQGSGYNSGGGQQGSGYNSGGGQQSGNDWSGDGGGQFRGTAGVDYPDYKEIPKTSFRCSQMPYVPGMYADVETQCQVYHVCHTGRKESFKCGPGTVFNQQILACDYWYSVECDESPNFYSVNAELGKTSYGDENILSPNGQQQSHHGSQGSGGYKSSGGSRQPSNSYQPGQSHHGSQGSSAGGSRQSSNSYQPEQSHHASQGSSGYIPSGDSRQPSNSYQSGQPSFPQGSKPKAQQGGYQQPKAQPGSYQQHKQPGSYQHPKYQQQSKTQPRPQPTQPRPQPTQPRPQQPGSFQPDESKTRPGGYRQTNLLPASGYQHNPKPKYQKPKPIPLRTTPKPFEPEYLEQTLMGSTRRKSDYSSKPPISNLPPFNPRPQLQLVIPNHSGAPSNSGFEGFNQAPETGWSSSGGFDQSSGTRFGGNLGGNQGWAGSPAQGNQGGVFGQQEGQRPRPQMMMMMGGAGGD